MTLAKLEGGVRLSRTSQTNGPAQLADPALSTGYRRRRWRLPEQASVTQLAIVVGGELVLEQRRPGVEGGGRIGRARWPTAGAERIAAPEGVAGVLLRAGCSQPALSAPPWGSWPADPERARMAAARQNHEL